MTEPTHLCTQHCPSHQDMFRSNVEVVTRLQRLSEDVGDMKSLLERVVTMEERSHAVMHIVEESTEEVRKLTNRVAALETELAVWKNLSERRMVIFGSFVALLAAVIQIVPTLLHVGS